jgi:hypothetical protein
MKKFILGLIAAVAAFWAFNYYQQKNREAQDLQASSQLIQQQIKNVSKLVVSEGHFSHVYNYRNSKEIFGPYYKANKRALVVVNAEVSIVFDLEKLTYEVEEPNKILRLTYIPEPEIKISPNLKYYDVTADVLNPFKAADYNRINRTVRSKLRKQVAKSNLAANAQSRLLSELAQFYILVNSMGWTLVYNEEPIENIEALSKQLESPQTFTNF